MISSGKREGQTLIETALILFLLLLILLGITEFARAWYTKSSLKNAARQGARVAAVTPITNLPTAPFFCTPTMTCPNSDAIVNAVCCQPGVRPPAKTPPAVVSASLSCTSCTGVPPTCSSVDCSSIVADDTVQVTVSYADPTFFILGNTPWPWPKSLSISTDASMRYE